MAQVLYTERAQSDLLEAWLFVAEENPAAADRMLYTIDQAVQALAQRPLIGRARPELDAGIRSWPTATP